MTRNFLSNSPSPAASQPPHKPASAPASPDSSAQPDSQRESVRHILYGSREAIARTIAILHLKGYAEPFQWSKPIPTQTPGEYMSILTRLLQLR